MYNGSNDKNKKIKIAFLDIGSERWTGGMYYYRNLFHAISMLDKHPIQPYIFIGKTIDKKLLEPLVPFVTIIQSSLFDHKSFFRNVARLVYLFTGSNILRNNFLKKHEIKIISHSNIIEKCSPFTTINWIPDFQYKHLPEMFSDKELRKRALLVKKIINRSNCIIVSSHDALEDLHTQTMLHPSHADTQVLHFTSYINLESRKSGEKHFKQIMEKYNISGKYFFLPNQFWKHKNHTVVLKALQILKSSEKKITVLCSGYMHDHRNMDHVAQLKQYIHAHNLEASIKFLGLIERRELITLMRFSLAIINPSLFEGWSSTVEEAKSIGKNLILSNLNVHREQDPPSCIYFDPHNPKQLAKILYTVWCKKNNESGYQLEEIAQKKLNTKMKNFGKNYLRIINKSLKNRLD